LLGSYRLEQGALVFVPQYPVQAGVPYRATFKAPGRDAVVQRFTIPKPDQTPTTIVERVYPSASVLPENQLKFYIHFSAPMSRGEAYSRVHLFDEQGKEVDRPFLTLTEELWDPEGCFTLFFDPGRVKRGLVPQRNGAVTEGHKYTFVIDHDWLDTEGKPLKADFRKPSVHPADRSSGRNWKITAQRPEQQTQSPSNFHEQWIMPCCNATRRARCIRNAVEGRVEIDRDETRWRFIPRSLETRCQVRMNGPDRPRKIWSIVVDVDVFDKVDERIIRETKDPLHHQLARGASTSELLQVFVHGICHRAVGERIVTHLNHRDDRVFEADAVVGFQGFAGACRLPCHSYNDRRIKSHSVISVQFHMPLPERG
jgi:hypothetical protein